MNFNIVGLLFFVLLGSVNSRAECKAVTEVEGLWKRGLIARWLGSESEVNVLKNPSGTYNFRIQTDNDKLSVLRVDMGLRFNVPQRLTVVIGETTKRELNVNASCDDEVIHLSILNNSKDGFAIQLVPIGRGSLHTTLGELVEGVLINIEEVVFNKE